MPGLIRASSISAKKAKAPTARKATTAAKPSLSAEIVLDSDDSGDVETKSLKKPTSKTVNSQSNLVKAAGPKLSTSQPKSVNKRKPSSPILIQDSSSSSGSEDDSSSEDEEISAKKRTLEVQGESPKANQKMATARPVQPQPSTKPSTNVKPLIEKERPQIGAAREDSKSETEESSGTSHTGSESGSEDESTPGSSDETSPQRDGRKVSVQTNVRQQSKANFKPPLGFESASIPLHPASRVSELLAPSNLRGKQIWRITAPESVPISLVKEVSTQNISKGASVLEYQGAEYGLIPQSENGNPNSQTLLLPSPQTNDYRPSNSIVTKILHLQQLVRLPSHADESTVRSNRSALGPESHEMTPRQQPEGLRMRYRPFGVSDDSDTSSHPESMLKAPEFRTPARVKEGSPGKKRKRPEPINGSDDTNPAVKSKKQKKSPHATAGTREDPVELDAAIDTRSIGRVESATKPPHSETNGVVNPQSNPPNGHEEMKERRKNKRKEKPKPADRQSPSPAKKLAPALPLDMKRDAETIQPGEVIEGASAANAVEGTKSMTNTVIVPPPSSSPPPRNEESKEEKAKRKEERRRRREEKEERRKGKMGTGMERGCAT